MTSPIKFLQETRQELIQVVWPKRDEIIRLTGVVLLFSLIIGLYIGGADLLFSNLIEAIIGR